MKMNLHSGELSREHDEVLRILEWRIFVTHIVQHIVFLDTLLGYFLDDHRGFNILLE